MASEIHSVNPQNLNLFNETVVYDMLQSNGCRLHDYLNYSENQEFSHFNSSNTLNDGFKFVDPNMNVTSTFDTMQASQTYNYFYSSNNNHVSNKNFDRRNGNKSRESFRTNSPKGYESDESSYSSMGTPDSTISKYSLESTHKQNKNKNRNQNFNNNNNNRKSTMYQPNLYQPNVNDNINRYSSHRLNHRTSQNKSSSDIIIRRAHGLMERFKSRTSSMRIDLNPPDLLNGGPWDQLNQAIWDVFLSKIQTEDTYVNKLNLWKSLFLFTRKCFSSYGLFLVGSTMSGFGLEGSDIDMCLLTKPTYSDPRVDSLHHLNHIKHLLLKSGLASEADLILAKVPILKFKNKETGFEVDLNCNNSVGIKNTHLLHSYGQLDWRVRPLVVIVKLWAQANSINDAKNMTISSYSLALMVIHYLQCGVSPPVLPCLHSLLPDKFNSTTDSHSMDVQEELEALKEFKSDNTSCLGDLLIGFFHYYAYFNYAQYAISVRTGSRLPIDECKFARTPKNDPNQWKWLCIEEPFDFTNTARSVFDYHIFKHIKDVILCSYKELARNKTLEYVLPVNLNRHR